MAALMMIEKLRSGELTLDSLQADLGIKATQHASLPLVILNYEQIGSPKSHPIVRECRSLCLEKDTWDLVARSFSRFYNWGELEEEHADFNFDDFRIDSKEDGSIITLYHYNGEWHANTRKSFGLGTVSSFGLGTVSSSTYTWRSLVCKALGLGELSDLNGNLTPGFSYVFELTSPYNKVVRTYTDTRMYLLAVFGPDGVEKSPACFPMDELTQSIGALRPTSYEFRSIAEIRTYLDDQAKSDPTFEGVVICDNGNRRWKIKNSSYLTLHKGSTGVSTTSPKFLLPFVLKGERSELLAYFPETEEAFDHVDIIVRTELEALVAVWEHCCSFETQREFAMAVLERANNRAMASLLFQVRKRNGGTEEVRCLFRRAEELILKTFFS